MKIAVAIENGHLAEHFGHAEQFAVFTATATTWAGPEYCIPSRLEESPALNVSKWLKSQFGCGPNTVKLDQIG